MFSPFPTSPKTDTNLKQHIQINATFTKSNAKYACCYAWSNAFHDATQLHDTSPNAKSLKHESSNALTNEPPHDDESSHDVDDAANASEHGRVPETNDVNFPTHVVEQLNASNAVIVTIITYYTSAAIVVALKSETHKTRVKTCDVVNGKVGCLTCGSIEQTTIVT
jgi:hypothetical protein